MNCRSVATRILGGLAAMALPVLLAAQQTAPPRPAPSRPMTDAELATAKPGPDPRQAIDTAYTRKIKEYTTQPYFLSPIVDYMPASKTVPTPEAVLGNIAGAPGKLPYSKEVYAYMRLLEKSTPRVKVVTIGMTEEGREMIAVAVASEQLMAKLDQNKGDLAKLADPRTIGMNDALADTIARRAAPVYYITGTIHSTEAGAPTALMELAYRLAVDDSPYIRNIREHVITLITPIVEVDGRDRVVDLYEYRKKHPDQIVPSLLYWGKYVGHDNNRDAMGLTLKLSQNVLDTYLGWKAQVLHDLHESVAFMYDNTIGDGPYNAWLDPILTNEWQLMGWNNVNEMTRWGMPGVFAFGTFDTWSPGYLMFMAATHNGISRLYETFGNGGSADTQDRTISASETTRTWYRQNPPLSRVRWSLRNNNNYEITGLLLSENYFATNRVYFLRNFYEKSKRSILKATTEGPAAYIFSADEVRSGTQAELLRLLQKQGVEISRASAPFTANLPVRAAAAGAGAGGGGGRGGRGGGGAAGQQPAAPPPSRDFPAGSYIVRMDQPYSRIADALLDYQYWAPNDPQKNPYDDTGWTFPEGFGVEAVRITDAAVLKVAMTQVKGEVTANRGVSGTGSVFLINHNADNALITLRYRLKTAEMQMAEEPFDAGGQHFSRGSFIISGVTQSELDRATTELGLKAWAVTATPLVKTHPARAARVAILHNWNSTQTEGWWRQAFDLYNIPYDYIDAGFVSKTPDLKARYDVIVAGPGISQGTLDGTAMYANPVPWKNTPEMPNIGTYAQTDDIRLGFQLEGLLNLRNFVQQGGAMVAATSSAEFLITNNLARGAAMSRPAATTRVVGSLLRSTVADQGSPIMYGIPTNLAVFSDAGAFLGGGGGGGGRGGGGGPAPAAGGGGRGGAGSARPTGRGTPDDPDVVQGRPATMGTEPLGPPLPADSLRPSNTMPAELRPRPLLRFDTQDKLLVSGLLDGGADIAGQNVVMDIPSEKGHYILFANNPIYRGTTLGSYFMVFNAILSFDNLGAGRAAAAGGAGAGGGARGGRGGGGGG